ncbi:hypothetical protein ACH4CE_35345 [Streptomyces gelaticus]|uniref:hypothetical protein n=1 Tax=Streptomyces gelaticus TaxID=285446 RepID=UPI0037AD138B
MSTPKRPKVSAATPDQVVELYGPDNDGWYDTRVKDWIALCEDLKDGEVRGYIVLRGLVVEKFKNHVRVLTLQKLCELIPGPSRGPSSLTRVRGILDGLTKVGLVTTPEGQPIKTSSRASALMKPLRLRINDSAPADYAGWRNAEDKLKALGTALADLVEEGSEEAAAAADQDGFEAGRKSDPVGSAGRISDPTGRISDPRGRISDPLTGGDLGERDLPLGFSSGSSLSPSVEDAAATSVTPGAETTKTRETAAPEDNPVSAAAEIPAPRDGQIDDEHRAELLEMLLGLPGRDRMNRDEVADMLLPLGIEALAAGWTAPKLRNHLARSCDPDRVFKPTAIYRMHLKQLPSAPAGAGAHPAAAAPECSKCNGSGLAEDPETFLPIGPCECRKAPALAAAS